MGEEWGMRIYDYWKSKTHTHTKKAWSRTYRKSRRWCRQAMKTQSQASTYLGKEDSRQARIRILEAKEAVQDHRSVLPRNSKKAWSCTIRHTRRWRRRRQAKKMRNKTITRSVQRRQRRPEVRWCGIDGNDDNCNRQKKTRREYQISMHKPGDKHELLTKKDS